MSSPGFSPPGFAAKTAALARKDLKVEWRARDTLPPMLAFTLVVSLVLAFALPATPAATPRLAGVLAGFAWITVLFCGLIGFARTFEMEREEAALDTILLVPLDRSGLWLAKALANLVFIATVEALLFPVFALLFSLDLLAELPTLLLVVVLVDIGFVSIGTLFASLAAQTRSRELLLPILALPVLVPVFVAAVELTADLWAGSGLDEVASRGWFGILIAFDVVVGVASALAFDYALD